MKTTLQRCSRAILFLSTLALSGCLSYSYVGLTDEKQLPTAAAVGMTFDQLVARFGAPFRIFSVRQGNTRSGTAMEAETKEGPGGPPGRGPVLLLYRRSASYQVLLYHRQRAHDFVLTLENGRVVAFRTALSTKSDGLSLSVFPAGGLSGGRQAGGAGNGASPLTP